MAHMKPRNDLKDVIKLANQGQVDFTARSVSIDAIMRIFEIDLERATEIAIEGITKLTPSDFYKVTYQWGDAYDEYGLENFYSHNWYIKFTIYSDDGETRLEEVSFHPLTKMMVVIDERMLAITLVEDKWRVPKKPEDI